MASGLGRFKRDSRNWVSSLTHLGCQWVVLNLGCSRESPGELKTILVAQAVKSPAVFWQFSHLPGLGTAELDQVEAWVLFLSFVRQIQSSVVIWG